MRCSSPFPLNHGLLQAAAERLAGARGIFWLLGASCTGKTTVCQCLEASNHVAIRDMDARIFGDYLDEYSETAHPASRAWLKRPDALQWALSFSWDEFNRLNEATNVEILDLFSREVRTSTETRPLVIDGGLSQPHLLVQVLPVANVICLQRDEEARAGTWERDANKREMRNMILALPDGPQLWDTFLHFDKMIAKTLEDQCRAAGIHIVRTEEGCDRADVAATIVDFWRLG